MDSSQRSDRKEKTRKAIMDSAFQLFSDNGIMSTTTQEIARNANISHGLIFSYFPTRDILILTMIEDFGLRLVSRMNELSQPLGSLEQTLESDLTVIAENEAFYARLMHEGPTIPQTARSSYIVNLNSISAKILAAIKREFKSEGMSDQSAQMWLRCWNGLVLYYLMYRDLIDPGKSVINEKKDEIISFFVKSIKGSIYETLSIMWKAHRTA
ncbi:MAG: TetR/AcrR family transcriptional regulator [Caldisericia bacterium]|nr:TetR/AcrR family transcriptional regulator [Caldisericia bacterium]